MASNNVFSEMAKKTGPHIKAKELAETLSFLKENKYLLDDVIASMKFDLGTLDDVLYMSDLSKMEIFKIPAPICLFMFDNNDEQFAFIAKDIGYNETHWIMFYRSNEYRWSFIDMIFAIKGDGTFVAANKNGNIFHSNEGLKAFGMLHEKLQTVLKYFLKLISAIEVFSCSNVITVEHKPNKLINEKRKNKGKIPFFSYHTLHIKNTYSRGQKPGGEGKHASPRLHFRRGHIRRLTDGRRIWVTSCLVGDKTKGFSMHDYRVAGCA